MKIKILIIVLIVFLSCKKHATKPISKKKVKILSEQISAKKNKDSLPITKEVKRKTRFSLFLDKKGFNHIHKTERDENHFLNHVYIIKNKNLNEFFNEIKGYEFDTEVVIGKKRILKNYKEEKEIPYYTQTVIKNDNIISQVNCEFIFDGGVTTIKLIQQGKDVVLRVEYST